jgi:hypothetical protein
LIQIYTEQGFYDLSRSSWKRSIDFWNKRWNFRRRIGSQVTYGLVESVSRSAAAIAATKAAVEAKKEEAKPKPETKIPAADEKAKPAEPTKAKTNPLPESNKPSIETKPTAEKNTQEPKKVPNP